MVFIPDTVESECEDIVSDEEEDVPLAQLSFNTANRVQYESCSSESDYDIDDIDNTSSEEECEGDEHLVNSKAPSSSNKKSGLKNYRWRKRPLHQVDSSFKGDEFDDPPHNTWSV